MSFSAIINDANNIMLSTKELYHVLAMSGAAESDGQVISRDKKIAALELAIENYFEPNRPKAISAMIRLFAVDLFLQKNANVITNHYREADNEMSIFLIEAFASLPLSLDVEYDLKQVIAFLKEKESSLELKKVKPTYFRH
ncbi:MAG: hypothetical protein Q7V63_07145 [Gammaproteobacteria bacterium]|nr:hypothetical protein [Gammaproteobacteria bacterium]